MEQRLGGTGDILASSAGCVSIGVGWPRSSVEERPRLPFRHLDSRAMAGRARVSALAKELGITSRDVMEKLAAMGEYVKSASSTVEEPVERRLREAFDVGKQPP